jgi:hypothetical protein
MQKMKSEPGVRSLKASFGLTMLEKEPLSFPSRTRFTYSPGISDRQLWAIGMVVVQWSMTEYLIDIDARKLIGNDKENLAEYQRQRNFQQLLGFWRAQIEAKRGEPLRTQLIGIIPRIQALSSQRDEVVHRLWGGGLESTSWEAGGAGPTTDAGLMPNLDEKMKRTEGLIPFTWHATFARIRRMAIEISTLNRDMLVLLMLPPAASPRGDAEAGG